MARPRKWRKVGSLPENNRFGPLGSAFDEENHVRMTVDEYEAIRLIDLEGHTQESCAEQMDVARTTVQSIYAEARRKLALFLVEGKALLIEGGEYILMGEHEGRCGRGRGHGHGEGGGRRRRGRHGGEDGNEGGETQQ